MKETYSIAIDGPSGAGKSTIAKRIAEILEIAYIDTGAMYRALGYKIIKEGLCLEDEKALRELLDRTNIDFVLGDIILDGEVVSHLIRTPEISKMASDCSAIPMVREKLVDLQRKMGEAKTVIMDGRDIGTNVLTQAECKFFMTASAEERARRRHIELREKGEDVTFAQVLEDMTKRDYNDMNRKINPLRKAEDALEVNTDGMSVDEVTYFVLAEIGKIIGTKQ